MRDPRIDKLAEVLVNYSVSVRRNDVVRIVGSTIAMPLIRAVYRQGFLTVTIPKRQDTGPKVVEVNIR